MGAFDTLTLPRVSKGAVDHALAGRGVRWEDACHVTATTTVTRAVRDAKGNALQIATLRDLVIMPTLPGELALPLDDLAARPPGSDAFLRQLGRFQERATGRRLRTGLQVDQSLRRFVRSEGGPVARALLASRRSWAATVHTMVAAGVQPEHLEPSDTMGETAVRAWAQAEQDVDALGHPRDLLCLSPEELGRPDGGRGRRLSDLLRKALDVAFGPAVAGRRTIVHHGFYFYTPPQWFVFLALRLLDEVDQLFVVHDDGTNPALATWRYFFRSEWGMPTPSIRGVEPDVECSPAARWLRGALLGRLEGDLSQVRLLEYRSPVELVRDWAAEDEAAGEDDKRSRFAAQADDVQRLVARLGRSDDAGSPTLSQLPVGLFLLALHSCFVRETGGEVGIEITPERMLDVVSSGFHPASGRIRTSTFRRTLPYFDNCRTAQEWLDRAALLRDTVEERVNRLPARRDSVTDLERIEDAAENPVRLAGWVDLTREEAQAVEHVVRDVVRTVQDVLSRERVRIGDHLERIREALERVLRAYPAAERERMEDRLQGFGVLSDEEIDVDGLVDVVSMLVGRKADFDHGAPSDDDPTGGDGAGSRSRVLALRGLDRLAVTESDRPLHLTNLAEDVLPTSVPAVGWPFTLEVLQHGMERGLEPVVVELMSTRAATAALGDLYLMWLALDGSQEHGITLSWISGGAGEHRRLSPLVQLLARLSHPDDDVVAVAGGVEKKNPTESDALTSLGQVLAPHGRLGVDNLVDQVRDAVEDGVHPVAGASSLACPRRFALQWALGPSAGFGSDHMGSMLVGNLENALMSGFQQEKPNEARVTVDRVWPHLTPGQRTTSRDKAMVRPSGGAAPSWVWTLSGTRQGGKALDHAYQAAMEPDWLPAVEDLAPEGSSFLPPGISGDGAHEVCLRCPVRSRCLHAKEAER